MSRQAQTRSLPECRRLAAELRSLRERCGLSLVSLGAKTAYSKSAWERYLNSKAMPPWSAVQALGRLADEPEPRLRVLWELAESAWSGRGAVAKTASAPRASKIAEPAPTPEPVVTPTTDPVTEPVTGIPAPSTTRRRFPHLRVARASTLICAVIAAGIGLALGVTTTLSDAQERPQPQNTIPSRSYYQFQVLCTGLDCTGQDPSPTQCGSQPQTLLDTQTSADAGIEIRYNPACHAAWTRIWHTAIGDSASISAAGQPTQVVTVPDAKSTEAFLYTPMIAVSSSDTLLIACLTPHDGQTQCFSVRSP